MKQLDGVEWEIENIWGMEIGDEIEGPTFYVNNYRVIIYCIIKMFHLVLVFSISHFVLSS